jgi:hypothetical protein
MPTRASKTGKKRDFTQIAKNIVDQVTRDFDASATLEKFMALRKKNSHAVALSKLGASKGGKARAKSLSARRRKEIALKAIKARWKKK